MENPAPADGRPEIWVAREDGRLLGQYASMPVRLWWGAREVRSSWGMDVFLATGGARPRAWARSCSRRGATTWRWPWAWG